MRARVEDILRSFEPPLPAATPPAQDPPHQPKAGGAVTLPRLEPQVPSPQDVPHKAPARDPTPMEEVVSEINDLLIREAGGPELLTNERLRLGRFRFSIFGFEHQFDIHVAEGTHPQQIAADVTSIAKSTLIENGCRESELRSLRLLSGEWLT